MNRVCSVAFTLASLAAFLPHAAHGQALPTATRSGMFQAGVGGEYLHNDYAPHHNAGPIAYVDYNFLSAFRLHVGLEAEARFGGLDSPDDIAENSYLVGPRISYRRGNLTVYVKGMVGRGTIFHNSADNNTSSSFNLLAGGGGLEYRVFGHFNIRAVDIERQSWPGFPPNGLTPYMYSAGVAYIIR